MGESKGNYESNTDTYNNGSLGRNNGAGNHNH